IAPPPLSDLLDCRVPYVELLAMICVSRVYDCDALLEGLRAPPVIGRPSPAASANGATQTASSAAPAMMQSRADMLFSLRRCRGHTSPTASNAQGCGRQSSRRCSAS